LQNKNHACFSSVWTMALLQWKATQIWCISDAYAWTTQSLRVLGTYHTHTFACTILLPASAHDHSCWFRIQPQSIQNGTGHTCGTTWHTAWSSAADFTCTNECGFLSCREAVEWIMLLVRRSLLPALESSARMHAPYIIYGVDQRLGPHG
jgi:hypothetical protein